jgi:cytochrome b561
MQHAETEMIQAGRVVSPIRLLSAAESVSWAGTALPLTVCAAIWGIGDAAPAEVAWLTIAHGVIGTVASVWTVLQLALRWWAPRASRKATASWPKARLLAIYALLVLQPMLAIASSMLHGDHVTLFGILLPSVLPMNQQAALQVDRLHGGNAIALLALIALHIGSACGLCVSNRRKDLG